MILDGAGLSRQISEKIRDAHEDILHSLRLDVILVGDSPSSLSYVKMKKRKCEELGIACNINNYAKDISQESLQMEIERLNNDTSVTGILVQLPLPENINSREVLDSVDKNKDVDALGSYHLMKILLNQEELIPCTPRGILTLLENYDISLMGKNVCVIGFSDVVGKPLATLCLNRGATVTVCHIHTKNLKEHTLASDIIMTATGVPGLIKEDMVQDGAIVVDIGISKVEGRIVGDVDFPAVKDKCSYITPVPGGVGPMTIISLVENLVRLYKLVA